MLPLTRHGWREMLVGAILLIAVALGLSLIWRPLALLALPVFVWLFAFFRDPERKIPGDPGAFVSPADGMVSDITQIEHDELLNAPAVRVGIFLSVFNVHINRSPCDGRVLAVRYKKGKFINAMHHSSASADNESNTIVLAESGGQRPVAVVKQIVGLIARRIVCSIAESQDLTRGQRIGMIKFGSRTELTIPLWLLPEIRVSVGQHVRGAMDIIAIAKAPMKTDPRPAMQETSS